MHELRRTVRFCVSPAGVEEAFAGVMGESVKSTRHNTYAAWPAMDGLGAYYELEVACRGGVDPVTGYLVNIAEIDRATRASVLPMIERAFRKGQSERAEELIPSVFEALHVALGASLAGVTWRLTPYHWLAMRTSSRSRVILSQHFEFSAAHRLHAPELSDEENREVFGKCNNPNGHGHNYRLRVDVSIRPSGAGTPGFRLADLERLVDETVIRRFDHKHLNHDVPDFAAMNPSVENIAMVCHDLLAEPVGQAGAELRQVTVWETEKTSCTYPADPI